MYQNFLVETLYMNVIYIKPNSKVCKTFQYIKLGDFLKIIQQGYYNRDENSLRRWVGGSVSGDP